MLAVGRADAVVHHQQELSVVQAQQARAVHRRPDALRIADPCPRLLVAGDRLLAEPRARLREQLGAHHALVDDLPPQPALATVEAAAADQARERKGRMEHALPVHAHQRPVIAQRQIRKALIQIVVAGND